jgi:DNA-binding winged helix-turn-helix (wHTH) protein
MIFRFELFQLDIAERRLLRSDELIPLRAKVFDTLCILVENHGRLIRKDELMQRLWPDRLLKRTTSTTTFRSFAALFKTALTAGNSSRPCRARDIALLPKCSK